MSAPDYPPPPCCRPLGVAFDTGTGRHVHFCVVRNPFAGHLIYTFSGRPISWVSWASSTFAKRHHILQQQADSRVAEDAAFYAGVLAVGAGGGICRERKSGYLYTYTLSAEALPVLGWRPTWPIIGWGPTPRFNTNSHDPVEFSKLFDIVAAEGELPACLLTPT